MDRRFTQADCALSPHPSAWLCSFATTKGEGRLVTLAEAAETAQVLTGVLEAVSERVDVLRTSNGQLLSLKQRGRGHWSDLLGCLLQLGCLLSWLGGDDWVGRGGARNEWRNETPRMHEGEDRAS